MPPLLFLFLLLTLSKPTYQITYLCNSNAPCGCSTNPALITKIVGGENASTNTWGWAVSLYIDENWLCGGSILSSSWILTAAHCVEDMQPSQVIVSAGTNQLFGWKQWRYASSIIAHPEYDDEMAANDIALIKVSPPFDMTDVGIAKICLPMSTTEDYPPVNSALVAIGWGLTMENGNVSETLRQITLQRIPYKSRTCFSFISNDSIEFCAGAGIDGKDVCFGDSGGALMMFTSSNQWVVVGIVSHAYGACALAKFPSIFTRVVFYLDWIRSMNVTDAITVRTTPTTSHFTTDMTTTLTNNMLNSTSNSLSCYQPIYILFIITPIILLSVFISL